MRSRRFPTVLLDLCLWLVADSATAEPPRFDLYGDPLPPSAIARMGTARLKHGNHVEEAVFAPDGKTLVTGGRDKCLRVWDLASGRELWQLHRDAHTGLIVAPNGKTLAASFGYGDVRVLELATGKEVCRLAALDTHGLPLALSPDGRTLAAAEGNRKRVRLWDAITGRPLRLLLEEGGTGVGHAAFRPDGKVLVTFDDDAHVRVWDVATGVVTRRLTPAQTGVEPKGKEWVGIGAISPDGAAVAFMREKGGFLVWDVAADRERFRMARGSRYAAFSGDGKRFACPVGNNVAVVDAFIGRAVGEIPEEGSNPHLLSLSHDGRLAIAMNSGYFVRLWNADTGKELPRVPEARVAEHRDSVRAVAFSPSGKTLATFGDDRTLRLWEADTGRHLRLIELGADRFPRRLGNDSPRVFFTPDGRVVVASLDLQSFAAWEGATGREVEDKVGRRAVADFLTAPTGPVRAVVETDGLATFALHLFKADTEKKISSISDPRLWLMDPFALSPDGRLLASGTINQQSAFGGYSRGFLPKRDDGVYLWEVATGKLLLKMRPAGVRADAVTTTVVLFAPDRRTLVTGGADGNVRVWEVATGRQLGQVKGEGNRVYSLAFTADGERLATAPGNSLALVWDYKPPGWRPPKEKPGAGELARHWDALGGEDAPAAHRAVFSLAASPAEAVPFLTAKLTSPITPEQLRRLIADLNHDDFDRREAATRELEKLYGSAEKELRGTLLTTDSPEVKVRVRRLLEALEEKGGVWQPQMLRAVRGVWALERMGTAEARKVLETLAGGVEGTRVQSEAKCALDWLDRRARLLRE